MVRVAGSRRARPVSAGASSGLSSTCRQASLQTWAPAWETGFESTDGQVNQARETAHHNRRSFLPALTIERAVLGILLALLAVASLRLLATWARAAGFPYTLDYGESPLLNQIVLLARGQSIYPADWTRYPFVLTEHPPVYLALMAAFFQVTNPSFVAGRVVSLLAAALCAGLVAFIVRRLTRDPLAAIVAAGLWLAAPYVLYWSALARVDLVALALSLAGMAVAVRWPHARWSPLIGAFCMMAAVYTRQTYLLAGPLAVAGWYLAHGQRRGFVVFTSALAVGVLAIFAALNLATQNGFFLNTVASNVQSFSLQRLSLLVLRTGLIYAPLLAIACTVLWHARQDDSQATALLGLYLAGALVSSWTAGRAGAGENYFLELTAALSLIGGFALGRWRRSMPAPGLRALYMALLSVQVVFFLVLGQPHVKAIAQRVELRSELAQLQAQVAQEQGPILADEQLGLLTLAGKEVLLRPFHFSQLARQGRWDQAPVLADIRAQRFAMILISDQPPLYSEALARDRWTPEMWEAIQSSYRPAGVLAGTMILRPRP